MRRVARVVALACSVLLGITFVVAAQEVSGQSAPQTFPDRAREISIALSEDQISELTAWLTAMEKWQRYQARWNNRPARDGLGRIAPRRQVPDHPEWLPAHCKAAAEAHLRLATDEETACRLLEDPLAPIASVPTAAQRARLEAEKGPKHTSFLTRIHIDGLWTTASSNNRFYGIVGSHVTLVDVGRLQVFGPPGVLLLSVPDVNGDRRMTLGYTWGLSVRLTDVRLFSGTKDMTLFLNLSKVWTASGGNRNGTGSGYDMMGLSIAPRKKR
jgi:hypothetical protein